MNRLVYFIPLAIINIALNGATDCPDFWISYHSSCYLFAHQNYSFVEAQYYCKVHHGGHLVHIESQDENAFLKSHLHYMTDKNRWIGLTDEEVEGVWVWSGTDRKPEFKGWGMGEPNGRQDENCGEFTEYLLWNDVPCGGHKLFICEKE